MLHTQVMFHRKTPEVLTRLYDWDASAKAFVIRVAIGDYSDMFNELDASPLRKRDIDEALLNYLYDCSKDIPARWNIRIEFVADDTDRDVHKEERVLAGIHTNFDFIILYLRNELASTLRKSTLWVFISLALLFTAFTARASMPESPFASTAIEGLSIGGWVFLWEAMALVLFRSREKNQKLKRYQRLRKARKNFSYPLPTP